jgi:hypothetical protein
MMNSNIICFEDDLSYLVGLYNYGLSFLRSRLRGERIYALLLTEKGDHLPDHVKRHCGIEEAACPNDPDDLIRLLNEFANREPDAIHIVYLQQDLPIVKAEKTHRLSEICNNYTIVVIDWQFGVLLRGNHIRRQLDGGQHLLIACSAIDKSPDVIDELRTSSAWFASCQKADPSATQDDKIHSVLLRALTAVRRTGKSRQLFHCIGDITNPLGSYMHPGRTWESEFQSSIARFKANIPHARDYFNLNLRELLEPEEQQDFEGPDSEWSFQTIERAIDEAGDVDIKAKLEGWLGKKLKGRFRADLTEILINWVGDRRSLKNVVQDAMSNLPAAWDAYLYVPALENLLKLIKEPSEVEVTKSIEAPQWTKHVISAVQHGESPGGASENNLLKWNGDEVVAAISGARKKSDFEMICRVVSSYGPLLFERYNDDLRNEKYIAVRREGRKTNYATEEQVRQEFERTPLSFSANESLRQLVRFSFLLWMPGTDTRAEPSDQVAPDIGGSDGN